MSGLNPRASKLGAKGSEGDPNPQLFNPRGEVLTTLLIIGGFLGFLGVGSIRRTLAEHPSREVCQAMLDRYVEHVVHAHDSKPTPAELATRKAQARVLAAEDQAFARCPMHLTREEADCAMRSNTADEFERCLP